MALFSLRYNRHTRRGLVKLAGWLPRGQVRERLLEFLYPSDAVISFAPAESSDEEFGHQVADAHLLLELAEGETDDGRRIS